MLTRWLTFTAFLAASANPERAAIGRASPAVAPTRGVKGHPGEELTLNCGDRTDTGEVQYWHTPFGEVQPSGSHGELDPVFVHPDGSLVVPNSSLLHSGLYYCLLQHPEGATLWPYQLHVGPENQEHPEYRQGDAFRFSRTVGSVEERQAAEVSDGQFAGAVAASVLLTFVLGFSAGALARTHVLRCLGAVATRLRSPRKRCTGVTMTTLPATTTTTTTSPPNKPQRSFRQKPQVETTANLEGRDHGKDGEKEETEEGGRSLTEMNKGCDVEEEEERGFYLSGEDGGSQTGRGNGKERSDKDGRESTEEKREWRQGEVEEQQEEEEEEEEGGGGGGGGGGEPTGRRRRVLRLYQYDEDGRRFGHLPAPSPDEPGPPTGLRQRSLSLTRLNAIMAAASEGPLEERGRRERGREEEREEETHFHMQI
ncbi:hypothetical protein EPR50_G00030730 [Perca flavescens]|uniref:Ig-like domain-containing protein n=1 Tax=Perca flavescens TaxID=8167 RepID=A0A484DJG6_PERFV|nr:hypothetical protein EPR50_G00030730 [Perca flavescens]